MAIGVDYSAWMVRDGELKRRLIYQGSETNQYISTIYLDCKVEKGAVEPLTFLSFMFTPFRVIDGLDLGLSLATLDGGRPAPVGVNVTSVDDGEGALMSPRTPQGLRLLLSHLLSGKQLKFGIFQGPEQLVDMPFYNDPEFAQLHRAQVAALTMKSPKIPDGMIPNSRADRPVIESIRDQPDTKIFTTDRWNALVKYDAEISAAAETLRPHGEAWIEKLGREFFALQEDRSYLPNIVRVLLDEAKQELLLKKAKAERAEAERWARDFMQTFDGEVCSIESINILRKAQERGYILSVDDRKTICVTTDGFGTSYLRSNSDIQRFGRFSDLSS